MTKCFLWLFCHIVIKMAVWIRVQMMRQWNIFHSKGAKSRSYGDSQGMLMLIWTYKWNLWPKRKVIQAENPSTVKKVWWHPFNLRHYHMVSPCSHCRMRHWFLYWPWVRYVKKDGSCDIQNRWSLSWWTLKISHVWVSQNPLWIHGLKSLTICTTTYILMKNGFIWPRLIQPYNLSLARHRCIEHVKVRGISQKSCSCVRWIGQDGIFMANVSLMARLASGLSSFKSQNIEPARIFRRAQWKQRVSPA